MRLLTFNIQIFFRYFKPYDHPEASGKPSSLFAPMGRDLQIIRELDPNYVWTITSRGFGPDAPLVVVSGIHLEHAEWLVVTEVPHNGERITFLLSPKWGFVDRAEIHEGIQQLDRLLVA